MKVLEVINIETLLGSLIGLMKECNLPILLHTRFGIHTFFLKEKIYCYVLGQEKDKYRVVKTSEMNPYRFFFWDPRYSLVLESYKDLGLEKDELIQIKFLPS